MPPKESASASSCSKLGRKGDPRMHRAVAARMADPNLPLLDALRHGGFQFPPTDGEHDSTVVDADGVTLGQRKNQLSRRLRLARKEQDEIESRRASVTIVTSSTSRLEGRSLSHDFNENDAAQRGLKRGSSLVTQEEVDEDVGRKAKFHPEYHPLYPSVHTGMEISRLSASGAASGVAIASLISTANSVGMTLEQLAMRLSTSPNLFATLSHTPDREEKSNLAVNLVLTDSRAIIQKSMLHAGYVASEIQEGSKDYLRVALKVWELEGKRLESLMGCQPNTERPGTFCACLPGVGGASSSAAGVSMTHGSCGRSADEHDSKPAAHESSCPDAGGRHVHRLSGKCGHKAIIHQPHGKPAHIDFVVDGRIECYEGIKPVGPKGRGAMWPSRYKCIDLACPTDPQKQHVACGSNVETVSEATNVEPKQLSLTEVDFDGKEWNIDFFSHDGQDDTLLGLIKLGDGDNGREQKGNGGGDNHGDDDDDHCCTSESSV